RGQALNLLAGLEQVVARAERLLAGALSDFLRAIQLDARTYLPELRAWLLPHLSWRGNRRAAQGDFEGAIEDSNQAIRLEPWAALHYYNRGLAWAGLDERAEAIADFSQAIKLDPHYFEAYNNRAAMWAEAGRLAEAIADLTRAI